MLESIRQGYHTIGAIVWTTFIDKIDVEKALQKLMSKGLIIQNEKRDGLHRIPVWDLAPDVAKRMGEEKKGLFGITRKKLPPGPYLRPEHLVRLFHQASCWCS